MSILAILIPAALGLGLIGLGAFFWALQNDQFEDPQGQAERILSDRFDNSPTGEDSEAS